MKVNWEFAGPEEDGIWQYYKLGIYFKYWTAWLTHTFQERKLNSKGFHPWVDLWGSDLGNWFS